MSSTRLTIGALLVGLATATQAADTGKKVVPTKMTCEEFVALDEAARPRVVAWITGYDQAGGRVAVAAEGVQLSAARTVRFASLTDCSAEPSGIYFDRSGTVLYVHALHRTGQDLSVMIAPEKQE